MRAFCSNWIFAGCLGVLTSFVGTAQAEDTAAHVNDWLKADLNAETITGNITVYSNAMKFQYGPGFGLSPTGQTRIFRIDPPANPKLRNGQTLCQQSGGQQPTYAAYGTLDASPGLPWSRLLFVKFFAGPDVPPATVVNDPYSNDPGLCGIYWYMLPVAGGGSPARVQQWVGASTDIMTRIPSMNVTPSSIDFPRGGEAIQIVPVGSDHPGIYRLDPPANPVTNQAPFFRLCDTGLPSFVAFLERPNNMRPADGPHELYLKVFTGSDVPAATVVRDPESDDPGRCLLAWFGTGSK